MSERLNELSASEALARIASGALSSEMLVRACLERIEEREPDVAAWIWLDPVRAIEVARGLDRAGTGGPLHGIPVGIKDIVDTCEMPTAYGSPIYRDHRPVADAVSVANTRRAGGFVLGKTVSTEFAFRYPGRTRNPHDLRHSPGGSSSGSAAAVAECMVPLAVGTQTAGSIIRPAAYCGVYGFKPTFGTLSFAGVRHLSESLDTLGCMARTLADIALYWSVLRGVPPRPVAPLARAPRIGLCRTQHWDSAQDATREHHEAAARELSAKGATVVDAELPPEFRDSLELYWRIATFETRNCLAHDLRWNRENISNAAREVIAAGGEIGYDTYVADLARAVRMRAVFERLLVDLDALLTPSSAGEAPVGLGHTGPIEFNYLWTLLYAPAITIPAFTGPNGLPIGTQIVGRRFDDERALAVAAWVDRALR